MTCRKAYCIFGIIVLILLSKIFIGCTTEIDLRNDSNSIPVVYCVLNLDEGKYDLSLTRSFSGSQNAYEMASDTSIVFYEDPIIFLEGLEEGYPIWSTDFLPLLYKREQGYFPTTPGNGFTAREQLKINTPDGYFTGYNRNISSLRLRLDIADSEAPAFSTIMVPPRPGVVEPSRVDENLSLYEFPHFRIVTKLNSHIKYFEVSVRVNYREMINTLEFKNHTFLLFEDVFVDPDGDELVKYVEPDVFFSHFAKSFKSAENVVYREFISFDLIISFGDQYFRDFYDTYFSSADYGGVPKGNIVNGIGVFSIIRSKRFSGFKFNHKCMDSLVNGHYTKHLKFSN